VNRRAALLALLLWGGVAHAQSGRARFAVELRDAGPGIGPAILERALAGPHIVIPPDRALVLLRRDSVYRTTVIVLGRDAVVEGSVRGDLIVVAGDLYMHPGGSITGRAIAIGGGIYESTLAQIGGGTQAFRDFTYDIATIPAGFALSYRTVVARETSTIEWPGIYGLAIPSYDRSNGLSLGFGPRFQRGSGTRGGAIVIEPRVTYRSQLGRLDPMLTVTDSVDRRTFFRVIGERGTFSNDKWIWSDLVNSAEFILLGDDARNYYRATRGDLLVAHRWEGVSWTLEPSVGARFERSSSVRPDSTAEGGPFTIFNQHDRDDRLRPNPPVEGGRIASGLVGATLDWADQGIVARARADLEIGDWSGGAAIDSSTRSTFGQLTFDGSIGFPTFGTQSFLFDAHAILTSHGLVPRQRWHYLGGPGTLPTLELLELGGDQLLFFDARYNFPINQIALPLGGSPTLTLREVVGGADRGRFPTLEQATGVRLSLSVFHVEVMADPVHHHVHESVGISVAR